VFGACAEAGNVPYEAIRDLLAGCVEHAPRSALAEHVVAHGAEIGRLTNRLTARVGAVGPLQAGDLDTTRRLLADAVVDLLRRLTALRPLLLVVDDLQWADHNSLHVLERLARSDIAGLMIVGTCREGHIGTGDFGGWLERLQRLPAVSVHGVGGLGQREMRVFLRDVAGHDLGDDGDRVVAHLFAETAGNPFFMVEVLRLLMLEGAIGRGEDGRWRVLTDLSLASAPHSIRAVVEERLGRLGAETSRVLEAAAVLGRDFDPQWIATMLGIEELRVLDLLDPAVRGSLVRETDVGAFEFAHALVQHTLYDTIGGTRRGALHRRAAITISATTGARSAPAATVADHWARTGRDDRPEVTAWSRRAGLAAMDALAPEDAAAWFERALAAASDDHDRLDLLIDLGRAQRWVDSTAFRTTLLAAASLAERLGDGAALVRAALANHRGGASRAGEVDRDRVEVLEKALSAVGDRDSADRALVLATIAMENSQGADIERSIGLADEALEVARRVGDEYTLFLVLLRITEATRIPATLDRRLLATRELFDIAERLDEPVQLGFAAVRDIRTKFEAARFDQVGRPFAVLDAVSHLDPFVQHNHSSLRAVDAQLHGRLAEAMTHAERARDLGLSENDATAVYVSTASMIRWDMGTLAEMVPVLERICRDFPGVVGFQPTAGLALVTAGETDRARQVLRAAAEQRFDHLPLNPLWAMTVSVYASLCIEVGDPSTAAMLYDLMAPLRGRANISVVSGNGLVTESLAALAVVAGRLDAAADDVADARAQADVLDAPVSAARSALTLARLHAAHGRDAAATAAAAVAAEGARRVGMARVAAQADVYARA
jgi:tetratricopeptide (TPR) repeat protein